MAEKYHMKHCTPINRAIEMTEIVYRVASEAKFFNRRVWCVDGVDYILTMMPLPNQRARSMRQ